MSEILELKREVSEMKQVIDRLCSLIEKKPLNKKWLKVSEFRKETGKTLEQVKYMREIKPEIWRHRAGEGVQINYELYKKEYQS